MKHAGLRAVIAGAGALGAYAAKNSAAYDSPPLLSVAIASLTLAALTGEAFWDISTTADDIERSNLAQRRIELSVAPLAGASRYS